MLPRKIHKNLETQPEPASQYADFFTKPVAFMLLSYIQNSTHVLNKINDIKNVGESLLVTMDAESLYTN